ncbi:MAG: SDR family oxidoreductase [Lachnospiraceae bacterium]|nr:SDR family oxidoreductase [Lachnospiraceae bacterium]
MQTLQGRTCVFSGASGGDGASAVRALCQGGMNVVMMTHQPEQARDLIAEIEAGGYPGKCTAVQDGSAQTPPVAEEEVYRRIFEEYGAIDVIISNTGGDGFEDSLDTVDTDTLLSEVGHLLGGSYTMLKCALPYLRQSRHPRVIFMTTVEGVRGGKLESFTNAVAKGAVLSLTKNCAARLAPEKITVNCIQKGAITRLINRGAAQNPAFKDTSAFLPYIPMGRLGTPEDLAQAICFLASEETSYITGTVLDLSGGLSLV